MWKQGALGLGVFFKLHNNLLLFNTLQMQKKSQAMQVYKHEKTALNLRFWTVSNN